ncbi:SusD family protein [bacterium A37T11]|nr:SusD family protein [bacterium A37T11]
MRKYFKKLIKPGLFAITACLLYSCDRYLEAKPDKKMAEPISLDDCDELLDNDNEMNTCFPAVGEAAADDYYLSLVNWEAITINEDRLNYHWDAGFTAQLNQWQLPYKAVMLANQVLQTLSKINRSTDTERYDRIRGSALFFRGYAFFYIAQVFAAAYDIGQATSLPGIPLRLSPDIDYPSERGTLENTYIQILNDLQEAASLLPAISAVPTRPSRPAAYAALARTYLNTGDYIKAGESAARALQDKASLLDYSQLDSNSTAPFVKFNKEVIFQASTGGNTALETSRACMDSILYESYDNHDLRKHLFFSRNGDGSHAFKGKYDAQINASPFSGIAIDELYLIRAESAARQGEIGPALEDLNTLLKNRWDKGHFIPLTAMDEIDALELVLRERRKELVLRNLRWTDLRRLNQQPRFAKTLTRILAGQRYVLPPNDTRYTLLIPQEVILNSTITQNPR